MASKIQTQKQVHSSGGPISKSNQRSLFKTSFLGLIFSFAILSCTSVDKKYQKFQTLTELESPFIDDQKESLEKKEKSLDPAPAQRSEIKDLYKQWQILGQKKSSTTSDKLLIQNKIILHSQKEEQKKQARKEVVSLIKNLDLSQIDQHIKNDKLQLLRDLLLFRKAEILISDKKFEKAISSLRELLHYVQDNTQIEELAKERLQALASKKRVSRYVIGAVLPLSGPHQRIGKRCLNGLQMGLGLYDKKPSKFKLAIVDSKGNPHASYDAVQNLFAKHQAIGIIGGVNSQTAAQLAKQAQKFMIPTIVLSQKSGLTKAGSYIFQNSITSKQIVETLVDTLIEKLDHKKFSILYPNDPFGVEYANLFWDRVVSKGHEITGIQTYKPDETDFDNSMKRLIGTYYFEDRDEEYIQLLKKEISSKKPLKDLRKIRDQLPPIVDFSVLFIPDSIKSLHLIAPYIPFRNIEEMTLAGPGLWNSPQILKQASKNIKDIIFADALIVNHPEFKASSFYKRFKKIFGYSPGLFEVLSYESAASFKKVISSGSQNRDDLRENLSRLEGLTSPVGELKISQNREFIHPVTVFTIKEGKILPLKP